jgi:hypothetical protein
MTRLFYKDLKAHESAYRNNRADEAVNDLLLGAKVNAYTSLEDAKNKSVDEIATNYGKFLKALKTKDIPLLNKSTDAEKKVTMPSSQRTTAQISEPASSVIDRLNAELTPEQQKINQAYNVIQNTTNIASALKQIKTEMGGPDDDMTKYFEKILHANGYKASTNSKSKTSKLAVPNIKVIETVVDAMRQQYFNPTN